MIGRELVKVGDVVVVPEGHGGMSGKLGRVTYIGTLRCRVEVPLTTAPDTSAEVRVGLRALEQQAKRKRVEAEQANIRG